MEYYRKRRRKFTEKKCQISTPKKIDKNVNNLGLAQIMFPLCGVLTMARFNNSL